MHVMDFTFIHVCEAAGGGKRVVQCVSCSERPREGRWGARRDADRAGGVGRDAHCPSPNGRNL